VDRLKQYLIKNFEQVFVLLILITISYITYYIPFKLAFMNFFFLPVIIAGYFLGIRSSVLGAFLCILFVLIYVIIYPRMFLLPTTELDLYLYVLAWGGFLILSGAVVGIQQDKLRKEIDQTCRLNDDLAQHQNELHEANLALHEYSGNLEAKVSERTEELEKSKDAVERLKTRVEETLYSTMDSSVAKLMIEGRLRNEKRKISLMFSDLVGFTTYSEERSPELVIRDLNRYINDMEPIILDYNGHIDKYMGDGIMCEFGAPVDFDNYRLLAVMAALKMQERMTRYDYPWRMRIGIASGSAIMGIIGSRRQSYTTIGDVVNVAARLEKACPPGSVLIDEYTLEGTRRFIDVRLLKALPTAEHVDEKAEAELEALHEKLNGVPDEHDRAPTYFEMGRIYMNLGEYTDAVRYFEQTMQIQPDNVEVKLAFAEATLKKDACQKIQVKGRKKRLAAYEAIGLKDMLHHKKFPPSFLERYAGVADLISIPENIVLPVEALDGSIGHSKAVAVLSFAMATELGISEQDKMEIIQAGFAADLGKAIIPFHSLNRSGSLTDSEFKEVRKHPSETVSMLKKMGYDSQLMLDIVRHSHERINGTGFPDGLSGEEIPLGARVVAVADAYSAMTAWRPYREELDRQAALDEIEHGAAKGVFDPVVVQALIRAFR